MAAQQTRLDNIANNLANVSTTAFKKSRESFEDLFYQELTHGGMSASTSRVEVGSGVSLSGIVKDHRNGQIMSTGGTFDLAIEGKGYFQVENQEGETFFTRDGNFKTDQDGVLRTAAGLTLSGNILYPVMPNASPFLRMEPFSLREGLKRQPSVSSNCAPL
jgi:flagellar basal-body rod protein FlgG